MLDVCFLETWNAWALALPTSDISVVCCASLHVCSLFVLYKTFENIRGMRRNTNYLIITHEECLAWPGRISGLDNGLPGPSCPVLLSTYCDCAGTGRGRGRGLLGTLCSACLDKHANKHINIQLGIFHAPWAEYGTHGHNPLSRVSPLRSGGRKVLAIGNFFVAETLH